jgi:hypothetical protein
MKFYSVVNEENEIQYVVAINEQSDRPFKKIFKYNDYLLCRTAVIRDDLEVVNWWKQWDAESPEKAIWEERETYDRLLLVRANGRGYSGGHNTADRLGWSVSYPSPKRTAVLWWDSSHQGTWTGNYPQTTSLVPVPAVEAA